jgi:methionyl-tRNA formyltransferase
MRMEEGLETGPMLLQRARPIVGKNAGQDTQELAELGADVLLEWLGKPTPPVPQFDEGATYAAKVAKAEARIEWRRSANEVVRQVLAFAPAPGAWFEASGERLKVLDAELAEGFGAPGKVLDDRLAVACAEGAVRPLVVQRAGRAPMTARELLRGFAIPAGTVLR